MPASALVTVPLPAPILFTVSEPLPVGMFVATTNDERLSALPHTTWLVLSTDVVTSTPTATPLWAEDASVCALPGAAESLTDAPASELFSSAVAAVPLRRGAAASPGTTVAAASLMTVAAAGAARAPKPRIAAISAIMRT
jgi:hypothetical protein